MKATPTNIKQTVIGFGGKENIKSLDCCITRIRVYLYNLDLKKDCAFFQALGFSHCLQEGEEFQLVVGTHVFEFKDKILQYLQKN